MLWTEQRSLIREFHKDIQSDLSVIHFWMKEESNLPFVSEAPVLKTIVE